MTEKANESVTAKGRPSGTAITMTVIAMIMILIISSKDSDLDSSVPNHPILLSINLLMMKLANPAKRAIKAQYTPSLPN